MITIPYVEWNHLTFQQQLHRLEFGRPDLEKDFVFTCGVYIQRSDSDLAYGQILNHFKPRRGCDFNLYDRNELDDENFSFDDLGDIDEYEKSSLKELSLLCKQKETMCIFPMERGLYIIFYRNCE
jgi:hypothetical protein